MQPEHIEDPLHISDTIIDDIIDAEGRQHLSKLSLLVSGIAGLRSLILPLIALGYTLTDKIGFSLLLFAFAAFIGISLAISYLAWRKFTYHIGAEEIRIESGILSRNTRSIPYERIQDVSIEQKLIARLLGITAVKFETGSSEGDEGTLEFVSLEEAENLRQLVRARKSGSQTTASTAALDALDEHISSTVSDEVIFAMDVKRVFTLGTFNFSLVIFAIAAGAVQQFDFLLPGDIGDLIDYFVASFDETSTSIKSVAMTSQILGIIIVLMIIVIIGMLSGQLQTFLREYGFTLTQTDRGIRRKRGLVTLTDVVMPLHRVQAAVIQTGAIRKQFGWHALKFTSLGSDTGAESSHMIAPLAKDYEYWPIAALANITTPDDNLAFGRSHISYLIPSLFFGLFFVILSIIGSMTAPNQWHFSWIWIAAIIPISYGLLSWRYHFHAIDDQQIFVKSGFWNQKMTILPMAKIQSVDIAQGPISQMMQVADVRFGIAGGSGLSTLTIHNVPLATAHHIRLACVNAAKDIDFSALIKAPKG